MRFSFNLSHENVDSGELELNVKCDGDDSHVAALYCSNCKTHLCEICSDSIHSWKCFAKHVVVRLVQNPEQSISCHLHPQKTAELICKKPDCEGFNEPICVWCHQYEQHKGHEYESLGKEYNKIQQSILGSLKKIEEKREIFDKNLEEFDRCISSFSTIDGSFMKSERDKIDNYYSDARDLALKGFDEVANYRVGRLKSMKNQCVREKDELENLRTLLRDFEKMGIKDMIKNGDDVEKMVIQAGKSVDEPEDVLPANGYYVKLPDFQAMNMKIYTNPIEVSEATRLDNQKKKIIAVYFVATRREVTPLPDDLFSLEDTWKIEKTNEGEIYSYNNGRTIFSLKERPTENTIDLSRFRYTALVGCNTFNGLQGQNLLKEQMKNQWCSRIIISIVNSDWEDEEFMEKMRNIAKTDERVEIMRCPRWKFNEVLFQN